MATAGRFWFRCPAYVISRACRGSRPSPQFISISDGSWFSTSAFIERIAHQSMCQAAVWENSSLTSIPTGLLRNGMATAAAPVFRSVRRLVVGSALPEPSAAASDRMCLPGRPAIHEQVNGVWLAGSAVSSGRAGWAPGVKEVGQSRARTRNRNGRAGRGEIMALSAYRPPRTRCTVSAKHSETRRATG